MSKKSSMASPHEKDHAGAAGRRSFYREINNPASGLHQTLPNVLVLKDNPGMHVRMAGYTSATGSEEVNQQLSEQRASAVRDYLVEKGVASERITIIGYGRTKPALYEANPGDVHSAEAKANMRVLFEVVVE
jgi:hypothetical protein